MESILAVMIFFELILVAVAAYLLNAELYRRQVEKEKKKNREQMNCKEILNDFEKRA